MPHSPMPNHLPRTDADHSPVLEGRELRLEYDGNRVIDALNIDIPASKVTVLVGSNGCGKSTLLKSFARLLKPTVGTVLLNGQDIQRKPTLQVARELSILPQTPVAPEGLSVHQLVRMGRYPHQTWLQQWSVADQEKIDQTLHATDLYALRDRPVDALSGGQRQRAWIAMTLAQDTPILLLDEPTTYLDLAHQVEVLDLLEDLNIDHGKTIVMVLHDLNLAARYAHHMVALHDRGVYAQGAPADILDERTVKAVFDLDCRIIADPIYGTPLCVPIGRGKRPLRSR